MLSRTVSIAPMMGYTDRHARYFFRLISQNVLLYTEMVTTGAVLRGDRDYLLQYHAAEHPLALQLGGSDPDELAESAEIAESLGFDEVNLNVGCPSDRVQSGKFGACLMAEPALVAECIAAMQARVRIPVTVKCRIGIDEMDAYSDLERFVETVSSAGCSVFVVHARKAWLKGLSPKQNRDIPPLRYEDVYRLKKEHPSLTIVINGGIKTSEEIDLHLQHVDGVMLGREVYHNPYLLADFDRRYYGSQLPVISRHQVVSKLVDYIDDEMTRGTRMHSITRHLHGLFLACSGSRNWRRQLSESAQLSHVDSSFLVRCLEHMPQALQGCVSS